MNENDLLTIIEVADWLDCSQNAIRRWVAMGRFPQPLRVGLRLIRWHRGTIEKWLEERVEAQEEVILK